MGLVAWLLVRVTVVFLGLEVGAGVLAHVTHNVWVASLVHPSLRLLAWLLPGLMVPGMEEPEGWAAVEIGLRPQLVQPLLRVAWHPLRERPPQREDKCAGRVIPRSSMIQRIECGARSRVRSDPRPGLTWSALQVLPLCS